MLNTQNTKTKMSFCPAILCAIMLFTVAQSANAETSMGQTNNLAVTDKRIAVLENFIRTLAGNGVTTDEAIVMARTLNSHNKPPLSDQEVDTAVKSIYNTSLPSEEDKKNPAVVPPKQVDASTVEQPSAQPQEGLPSWAPKVLGLQFNGIYQNVPGFNSPYAGDHSFRVDGGRGHNITHIYGVYLGSQILPTLQAYVDIEMVRGSGVSKGLGLGGYVDGDVIKSGTADLGIGPYIARAYLRYYYPLSSDAEAIGRGIDQLLGAEPTSRLEIKAGKLSGADDFDQNRYANSVRTQFFNLAFINNTAWDYAADTRGYSYGVVISVVKPSWRLTYGVFEEPTTVNGNKFDGHLLQAQGNNLELTLKPNSEGSVIRLLAYLNQARMGNYEEALQMGRNTAALPSVFVDEKLGRTKYGFGLNFEQPVADKGETGIFGRLGWNDGHNEDFNYTDVDRHVSLGAQLNGVHWGRQEDQVGCAYALDGLSSQHKNYLGAGGLSLFLGDGKLRYGLEQILEAYYRVQIGSYVQVSPDFQYIQNPGYNRDRGPAAVYSMRLHMSY